MFEEPTNIPVVLDTLTREQREAVRALIARAWIDGDNDNLRPTNTATFFAAENYARLALPEPAPRTVTRPRVEVFAGYQYRVVDAQQEKLAGDAVWRVTVVGPILRTRGDAARWLALWDNPTETVEVPDDA